MRHWIADAEYRYCFDQIARHLERTKAGKPHFAATDAETIAFPAALAEEAGDFEKARKGWDELKQQGGFSAWGLFATRRLEEMDRADTEAVRCKKSWIRSRSFTAIWTRTTPTCPR